MVFHLKEDNHIKGCTPFKQKTGQVNGTTKRFMRDVDKIVYQKQFILLGNSCSLPDVSYINNRMKGEQGTFFLP